MFKVNNRNTRTRCGSARRRSGVFIVNFEHISHLVLIVNFEQVNANWISKQEDLIKNFKYKGS